MTGNDIFSIASGYMAQLMADNTDYKDHVPGMLSVLLQEALPYENGIRRRAGQTELPEAPEIRSETMNEAIDYHDVITRTALPFGLASDFFRIEDQYALMDDFRQKFVVALMDTVAATTSAITDLY